MRFDIGEMQEERPLAIRFDIAQCFGRELVWHVGQVRGNFHFFEASINRDRRIVFLHCRQKIIRVRRPIVFIEPVVGRQGLRDISQMPLADQAGSIAGLAQQRADGDLALGGNAFRAGIEDVLHRLHPRAVAPRQDGSSRWRADRSRRVEIGEAHAGVRRAIQVRRGDPFGAIAGNVVIAEIVGEKMNDVRRAFGCSRVDSGCQGQGLDEKSSIHTPLQVVTHASVTQPVGCPTG